MGLRFAPEGRGRCHGAVRKVSAIYNENDPYAARWLGNLVDGGHIAPGTVSAKSILDLEGRELAGFRQAHFFAGIGIWSAALRAAGWPDSRRVWTGSCPCQPFSAAGKGGGFDDERHLWPFWFWLIDQHLPDVIFGEQVEGPAGRAWLDLVFADLEAIGYSCGAVVFPAAGVGAPHIRHRTYWVADSSDAGRLGRGPGEAGTAREPSRLEPERLRDAGRLADASRERCSGEQVHLRGRETRQAVPETAGASGVGRLADAESERQCADQSGSDSRVRQQLAGPGPGSNRRDNGAVDRPSSTNGFWRDADWLGCRDDKWRPIEPGAFPLAHGASSRVGRLRAYGNAIVLEQAQAFIEAFLEVKGLSL